MHVTMVHLHIKQEHLADFLQAVRENHACSVQEPGNYRFDVLQSTQDPTRFVLYEWFSDAAAATAHKSSEHFARWQAKVPKWFASPRQAIEFRGLLPEFGAAHGV